MKELNIRASNINKHVFTQKTLNPKLNQTIVNTRSNIHVTYTYSNIPPINQKTSTPIFIFLVPKINSSNSNLCHGQTHFTKYFPILLSRLKTSCHEFQRVYKSGVYLDTSPRLPSKRNRRWSRSRFKVFHVAENLGKSNRLGGRERRHNICSVKSA